MNIKFIKEYIKHPRNIGAIMASSKRLSSSMIKDINFNNCSCIVEYGPGTGAFTEKIVKNIKDNTKVILIEYNKEFYEILKRKYGNIKNVYVVNDSAENINYYINKYDINKVDYVVSGLPFTTLPKDISEEILKNTKEILGSKGVFITFQYTKLMFLFINDYFKNIKASKEYFNFPPAYVLNCTNRL